MPKNVKWPSGKREKEKQPANKASDLSIKIWGNPRRIQKSGIGFKPRLQLGSLNPAEYLQFNLYFFLEINLECLFSCLK